MTDLRIQQDAICYQQILDKCCEQRSAELIIWPGELSLSVTFYLKLFLICRLKRDLDETLYE